MKSWTKNQLKRIRLALMINSDSRNKYLKEKNIFYSMGENVFFQPRIIPSDPKLIKFHNNIVVTSNVTFVNHDVFHLGLKSLGKGDYQYLQYPIEIMDNVFIGCNSTILGNVKIGPNAVVAAGSVVTKDVPPNSVVAGNPARVIESFDEFHEKRKKEVTNNSIESCWERFNKEKNKQEQ